MPLASNNYIDFHCHPALKPYGKSFNYGRTGENNPNRARTNSIWHYDPPSLGDKLINYLLGLTKFSQANFTSLAKGGVRVVCASLYPIEKEFFVNKIKNEMIRDIASNFATGVGRHRVDFVQGITDYYKDLTTEYAFYRQLDGKVIHLPEGKFQYRLINRFSEIEKIKSDDNEKLDTICVILSIEGLHVLNSDANAAPSEANLIKHIQGIKNWQHPPFFVGIAHHFWNHLCGHAESLTGFVKKKVNQAEGLNAGFTQLGRLVVDQLLSTSNGRRILIDIKHMSVAARKDFYKLMDTTPAYKGLPILISHGAANGMESFDNWEQMGSKVAKKLNAVDINFFNEELVRLAESNGLIGLQLDERRIASKQTLKDTKNSTRRSKIMHYRAELLWFQIQHILEVLDGAGLFAWDCLAIGSDYDGIIDPLNSYWTAEEFPFLADFLERHAYNYMKSAGFRVAENNLEADEIVERIMTTNGLRFLQKNFS